MQNQYSSGGILFNKNNQVYLVKNTKTNEWTIPKGKVENVEDFKQAAKREIYEETGIKDIEFLYDYPINIAHYHFTHEVSKIDFNKYVISFVFRTNEQNGIHTKEMVQENLIGEWFDYDKGYEILTHDTSKQSLKYAYDYINSNQIDVFMLGGNSVKNLDWIQKASENFLLTFPNNKILFYNHWCNSEKYQLNLNLEARKLANLGKNNQEYSVFAKSAGILITLIAIKDYGFSPKFCLFAGFPSNVFDEGNIEYESYLKGLNTKVVLLQNSQDPMGSYQKNKEIFERLDNKNIKLIETSGNTHDYLDFVLYKNIIKSTFL